MKSDPVCGMEVAEYAKAAELEYEGRVYLFCSEHCLHEFERHPADYAGREAPPAGATRDV
jgi:Cu+-exporting ATPase